MILSTIEEVAGYEIIEIIGIVQGNTVRVRHVGSDILAGFRNIIGGEVSEYTTLLTESREQALNRMTENAQNLGADGVVGIRFTTSTVSEGRAEILAYGTALKLQKS